MNTKTPRWMQYSVWGACSPVLRYRITTRNRYSRIRPARSLGTSASATSPHRTTSPLYHHTAPHRHHTTASPHRITAVPHHQRALAQVLPRHLPSPHCVVPREVRKEGLEAFQAVKAKAKAEAAAEAKAATPSAEVPFISGLLTKKGVVITTPLAVWGVWLDQDLRDRIFLSLRLRIHRLQCSVPSTHLAVVALLPPPLFPPSSAPLQCVLQAWVGRTHGKSGTASCGGRVRLR